MTAIFQPVNDREREFLSARPAKANPRGAKGVTFTEELQTAITETGWGWGSSYGMLYRAQPAIRTVVDFLARNIAQLTLKSYLRIANDDRVEIDDHPLSQLMRKPNPTTSRYRFLRDTVADKAVYDRAYWRLDRPLFPRTLLRVPPSRMVRQVDVATQTFVYRGPDGKIIPRDELVVFSGYSPEGAWLNEDGVAPAETLRRVLAEDWASQQNRANYWNNAARIAGVIERPLDAPNWSDEARVRFRTDWQNSMSGGANSGKTGILEEGMTWNPDAFSPKDSEYIAGRQLTREEVCIQYGIAPKLLGMGDIANANIDSFHRQLYQDTFGPWLKELQDDIELQLLPVVDTSDRKTQSRIYVEFNLSAKLAGSFEEQVRTFTTAVGVPWMAVHEARGRMNLPRIDDPDFDVPIKPLNVMYGNQPAVTVPTAVPQPKRTKSVAPRGALRRRDDAAKSFTELFRRYFRAQQKAARAKADAFDMDRWNLKLAGELYAARVALAGKTGRLAAAQIAGVYDDARTLNYHQEAARRQAENVNAQTAKALTESDDPSAVFDIAASSRSDYLGLSTVTSVISFARNEAATQSQAADGRERTKTWVVTSANSRHPELDGETIGTADTFSNGLLWPGDSSGDVSEVAGCSCLLDLA